MFWGLIIEPNKRYSQVVDKSFHISQAAIDISTGDNDPCQVMVVTEGRNFLLCTLQKNKCVQSPLDHYFKIGTSVSFLTNGKCNIHLTGYLDTAQDEQESEDEGSEEEQDKRKPLVNGNHKRMLTNKEKEPDSKKAKQDNGSVGEGSESGEDSNAGAGANENQEERDQVQDGLEGEDVNTDDNDESLKVDTASESTDSSSDEEEDDNEEGEEDSEESEESEEDDESAEEEEEQESSDEAETTLDTSKEEKIDMSKLTKSQKKRLKKKQKKAQQPQMNGIDKTQNEKEEDEPEEMEEDTKPQGKKAKETTGDKKEKKWLSGGVFIEDIKVGAGPVAKPGKTVMVHYEGRLKQNNKVFDNCKKGPGFKFRLGAKEVIAGWDVGVSGMKVGGKRKIVCPPAMAYGAKGSPPIIPSNATLIFEMELKNMK